MEPTSPGRALNRTTKAGAARMIAASSQGQSRGTGATLMAPLASGVASFDPTAKPTFGSLEGYTVSRILVKALKRIEGDITRESIVDVLDGLGQFDLGLGKPLELTQQEHQASHRIWPTVLENGRFVPFDWSQIANMVHD